MRLLILILTIAAALRLGLAVYLPTNLDQLPDQQEYRALAENLRNQHSLYFVDPRFGQKVYAYRMPGYPFFLALKPPGFSSVSWARVAQILIDMSTVVAIFLTARKLIDCNGQQAAEQQYPHSVTDEKPRSSGPSLKSLKVCSTNYSPALFAAVLVAVNPFFIYFSSLLLSETFFAALLSWGIFCFVRQSWWLGTAILIIAVYLKPTGILLLPAIVFVAALNSGTTTRPNRGPGPTYRLSDLLWRGLISMFLASAAMLLCLLPWMWRNHKVLGAAVWTTTNAGITAYDGFHPGATGASDQRFVTDFPQLRSMNELERSEYFGVAARDWIGRHWTAIPGLTVSKILRGWSPLPLSRDFARPVYRLISVSYELPFDVLCLMGLLSPRLNWRAKLLMATPAIVVTVAQAMTVGSIRYRMPAEAPLSVLAASGWMYGLEIIRRRFNT